MTVTSSPPVWRNSGVPPRPGLHLWRRLLRDRRARRAACWAIHWYIRLVYRTNRWTVENGEWPRRLLAAGRPFIGAFWHGRMMMIPMGWRRMAPMHMLISAHRDGRIIADAVAYFGIETIAGSTRRGGSAAIRTMLKRLKDGDCVAITPDGPRGPAMTASIGIVNVARLAQVPIVPITFATSRRRIAATWDQFHVALPFGRGIFLWGEPIEIAADLDEAGLEAARRLVEERMGDMLREADRRMGHASPPPETNGEVIKSEGALRPLAPADPRDGPQGPAARAEAQSKRPKSMNSRLRRSDETRPPANARPAEGRGNTTGTMTVSSAAVPDPPSPEGEGVGTPPVP